MMETDALHVFTPCPFGLKQNDQTVEKERGDRPAARAVVERTESPRLTAKEWAILLSSPLLPRGGLLSPSPLSHLLI